MSHAMLGTYEPWTCEPFEHQDIHMSLGPMSHAKPGAYEPWTCEPFLKSWISSELDRRFLLVWEISFSKSLVSNLKVSHRRPSD